MALTIELACTKSALVDQTNPNANYSGQDVYDLYETNGDRLLFVAFEQFPEALRDYRIQSVRLRVPFLSDAYPFEAGDFFSSSDFIPNQLTWANKPQLTFDTSDSADRPFFLPPKGLANFKDKQRIAAPAFALYAARETYSTGAYNIRPADVKMIVEYDPDETASIVVVSQANPKYINPRQDSKFSWVINTIGLSYNNAKGVTQASAVFYWRSGTSGDYNAIPVTGAAQSVTIPANTFPIGTIQYYISVTDTLGHTAQTGVYTTTTSDAQISAQPKSPINTVEDGSATIRLFWSITSPNGTAPTGFTVAWQFLGSSEFSYIDNIPGSARSYDVPADTFPAGTIRWWIRALNADGAAGPWSAVVSFISVAAPPAPRVNSDGAPFATISWQVEGQQAYRLTVDGKSYGPFFGTAKSFTLPDFLADGEHTATVEVQGIYGLWSQPGSITFNVANVSGEDVTLQGSFGTDAALAWQTQSQTANFLIYRDGVQIGHTAGNSFADRLVLGQHSYQVVNRLPDGNYSASNELTGCLRSCVTQIALAAGGEWLALRLSENQMNEEQFAYSRTYSLRHIAGAEYPVLELSPYLDGSARYNTAFATLPEAQAFEALKGQVVILKSRGGNVVIGALTDLQKRNGEFYIAYEFTIQRCHWEDYIDDADG